MSAAAGERSGPTPGPPWPEAGWPELIAQTDQPPEGLREQGAQDGEPDRQEQEPLEHLFPSRRGGEQDQQQGDRTIAQQERRYARLVDVRKIHGKPPQEEGDERDQDRKQSDAARAVGHLHAITSAPRDNGSARTPR